MDTASLQKELDRNGPFLRNKKGYFDPETFVKLNYIINKAGYKAFLTTKEELVERRLGFLRQQNMRQYAQVVAECSQKFTIHMTVAGKIALQMLDVSENTYKKSQEEAIKIPSVLAKMQKSEEKARQAVEKKNEVLLSKDELKKIYLEKISIEGQVEAKLAQLQTRSPQERTMILAVERTRVVDHLFLQHGIHTSDLMRAIKEH